MLKPVILYNQFMFSFCTHVPPCMFGSYSSHSFLIDILRIPFITSSTVFLDCDVASIHCISSICCCFWVISKDILKQVLLSVLCLVVALSDCIISHCLGGLFVITRNLLVFSHDMNKTKIIKSRGKNKTRMESQGLNLKERTKMFRSLKVSFTSVNIVLIVVPSDYTPFYF